MSWQRGGMRPAAYRRNARVRVTARRLNASAWTPASCSLLAAPRPRSPISSASPGKRQPLARPLALRRAGRAGRGASRSAGLARPGERPRVYGTGLAELPGMAGLTFGARVEHRPFLITLAAQEETASGAISSNGVEPCP
jgi:hypothetical protein